MNQVFDFSTVEQIHFGRGAMVHLADYINPGAGPVLVVTGRFNASSNPVSILLKEKQIEFLHVELHGEPDSGLLDNEVEKAKKAGVNLVVAMGGGSVLDAGKALAMLIANGGKAIDYAEVVGNGKKIEKKSISLIAIPTTAGTGSEVTKNAVVIFREKRAKTSIRHPLMLPQAAIIDPENMLTVPPDITASTGMDALTQVLEAYLSSRSNILVDSLCEKALPLALNALPAAYETGTDIIARESMAYVSLVGGLALANAGLGAVHGFAAAIGGLFDVPHGIICACFLPVVFEANYQTILKKNPAHPVLDKYRWFAGLCGADNGEVAKAIDTLYDLRFQLNIPGMRKFGMDRSMMGEIAQLAAKTSSMKGNPVELTQEQLMEIFVKCV